LVKGTKKLIYGVEDVVKILIMPVKDTVQLVDSEDPEGSEDTAGRIRKSVDIG